MSAWGVASEGKPVDRAAAAAMLVGVAGLIIFVLALPCGVLALALARRARLRHVDDDRDALARRMARTGIGLGVLDLGVAVLTVVLLLARH